MIQRGLTLFFMLSLGFLVFVGCQIFQHQKGKDVATNTWPQKMQGLSGELDEIMPLVYSKKAYHAPENRGKVLKNLEEFKASVHGITPEMSEEMLGKDPMIGYSLRKLQEDIGRAMDGYKSGQKEYSRGVMKAVVGHCFRCHTRNDVGPKVDTAELKFERLPMSRLEKAELAVALRKYSKAIEILEAILEDPSYTSQYPFVAERALQKYLAIMVRVKKDPQNAVKELEVIEGRSDLPYYLREDIQSWKRSLQQWAQEGESSGASGMLLQAKRLMDKARDAQEYEKDHAGDVYFLRATSKLHNYLAGKPSAENLQEAYYLLGQSYNVLGDLGQWSLQEVYYEACIREAPKTEISKICYRRLKESVELGYSGSSGLHIPASERVRLRSLREMINER